MKILPFPTLRPASLEDARSIASLPYDVMDTEEARIMAGGNPDSFLRIVRAEIEFSDDTDPYSEQIYQKARANLVSLVDRGKLMRDREPALYLYRQIMGSHEQTAIVACCLIDDYAEGRILKHEKTRQDKEDDRTRHILTVNANTGQVFLAYRDVAKVDALVAEECRTEPIYDFVSEDGVGHRVWKVRDSAPLVEAFEAVPHAYIADGHHRSAASYRAGSIRRANNPAHGGSEEYNGFMACLFPASQLQIMPYNRLVLSLNGLTPEEFIDKIREKFTVEPTDSAAPEQARQCHLYCSGRWWKLAWEADSSLSVYEQLDASVLQNRILSPVLDIRDPRTDTRIEFVGGIRGTDELVQKVDQGVAQAAFSMAPVNIAEVMAVADADGTMPPKSTWFEPKLRSGLLIHELD